jgi:hypothetical protein
VAEPEAQRGCLTSLFVLVTPLAVILLKYGCSTPLFHLLISLSLPPPQSLLPQLLLPSLLLRSWLGLPGRGKVALSALRVRPPQAQSRAKPCVAR